MILAVDVGGTKTLVALFDHHGRILHTKKLPTLAVYAEFIDQLVTTIRQDFWRPDIAAIGLAAPGVFWATTGKFSRFGNLPWEDVDMAAPLHQAFKVPVVTDNDANAGGLGAALALPETPATALYLTFGTGIGSGIITEGRIDPHFARSEAGHIMLEHQGVLQRWEDLCSGRAILRDYRQQAADISEPHIWKEISAKMALGLFALLPVVQPEVVLFGGGIGVYFEKYGPLLKSYLQPRLPALVPLPTFAQAAHPEEAVIYGCYHLAHQLITA